MTQVCLKIYVHQFQKHAGVQIYEWLIEEAKKREFPGGSAVLSLASFGHHGHIHESHFYELGGGNLAVEVTFVLSEKQADAFLALLKAENLKLFFTKFPVESGYSG